MKNKILPLLAVAIVSLTSCTLFKNNASHVQRICIYNLDKIQDGDDIENAFDTAVDARFKDNEPYIPYITLGQYASLYDSRLAEGFESKYTKTSSSATWSIFHDKDLYFFTQINFLSKQVTVGGSIEATFKDEVAQDTASLNYQANISYDGKYLSGNGFATYYFGDHLIKYFSYNNNFYISLGFLDMTYCFDSSVYFHYNYERIVSTREPDNFNQLNYRVDGQKCTANEEMAVAKKNAGEMPQYLRSYNGYLFLYFLDNFYGLKEEKGIDNAASFCKKIGTYYSIFSNNNTTRAQGIADTLSHLDDNHTALVSSSYAWGNPDFNRWTYADGVIDRAILNASLTGKRNRIYTSKFLTPGEDIVYSNDGKTAMFMFDEFVFGTSEQVFNDDGTIREGAFHYDTYLELVSIFNTIKNKGGVENVILDISTNGGGVVGVMMKLLSLISKSDTNTIHYLESASRQLASATTKIDSNNDNLYDQDDCFGDDFNIAILTSDCSFSAANAFACSAKKQNIAAIIGQTSGGGECAVAIHYLPNGEYLYHSSNLHLGHYDYHDEVFTGFEGGAKPDLAIENIDNFYDIEYLNQYVPACF